MSKSRPITTASAEDVFGVGTEAREPPADHFSHADGKPSGPEVRGGAPTAVLTLRSHPTPEVTENLADEERVAFGLSQQGVAQRDAVVGHLMTGDQLQQREESRSVNPRSTICSAPLAMQRREQLAHRMVGTDLRSRNVPSTPTRIGCSAVAT